MTTKTWKHVEFNSILSRKTNRIIGLSFPAQNISLGLEPSVLTVLPDGDNVEYAMKNIIFDDESVKYYLCSVYISGLDEFKSWAVKHNKDKIIVGGYHPTTFPEDFKNYAAKIVTGLCDDFYTTIEQSGQIVQGIYTYKKLPRYDLYDVKYNQQIIPDAFPTSIFASINTSIGCCFKCDFCCSPIMSPKIISKPLDIVQQEIEVIKKLYDPDFLFIRDENFPLQKDWKERLEIIHKTVPTTKIYLFASANTINEDTVSYMRYHGVYMICLGLEDVTSDYAKNKNLEEACNLLKKYNVYIYLSFIVNPLKVVGREVSEKFYMKLMDILYKLKPEMICGNFLMPFKGTKLWDDYYQHVSPEDYKYFDSKTAFLIRNPVLREKMHFFMFYYQWLYYTSNAYKEFREFDCGDTLSLRFLELKEKFVESYEGIWNVRC
ncbi:MAG: hypothetical protein Q7R33_04935 [Nitrosarchaeum sp.]|nr:hypothetical protein [Nitrosarchaeum sp.]